MKAITTVTAIGLVGSAGVMLYGVFHIFMADSETTDTAVDEKIRKGKQLLLIGAISGVVFGATAWAVYSKNK